MELKTFQTAKMTFKVINISRSLVMVPFARPHTISC